MPLQYFSRLRARGIEAWLLVHSRTREELLSTFPGDHDRILFVEDAWFHKLLFHLSFLLPRRVSESTIGLLSQLITQSLARRIVRKLVAGQAIDLVHQPIPVSPRFPSLITGVGAPVIIGPMNGGMEYPAAFRDGESAFTRFLVWAGRHAANFVNLLLPGKRHARMLLVANQRTRESLPGCVRGEVIELSENGVDLDLWRGCTEPPQTRAKAKEQLKFVFIGRLVDWKRVDIAIKALVDVPGAVLEIIGDGAMKRPWTELSETVGVGSRVTFSGWLSQPQCAASLRSARALVLPSIYESGGAVVLEAMASGIPVITTNWGGPADYVDANTGILIEPSDPGTMIRAFAHAMQLLAEDDALAARMGRAAREKVAENFDWEKKIDSVTAIYQKCIRIRDGATAS